MNAIRFTGANSREALLAVKRELGGDAVILANRSIEGGVEILALRGDALAAAERPVAGTPLPTPAAAPAAAARTGNDPRGGERTVGELAREVNALRGLLETQLGGLVWSELQRREPVQARLLRELLGAGFSPALARLVSAQLPAGAAPEKTAQLARSALCARIACAAKDEIVTRGGTYALMGPTGVGKTTTTAKLAARCVVEHGAEQVALLTTDTYRIGAHEQLRLYGRILGVPVHAVCDQQDLKGVLEDLRGRHIVLIDTVGMSQRDRRVAEHVGMLAGTGRVERLLLLSACAGADSLDETVRAYRGYAQLAGVVITKLDEAVSIGGTLDVVIRHRLKLQYITNGQRVPEDLHVANRDYLLDRALNAPPAAAELQLEDGDLPAVLAPLGRAAPARSEMVRA